MKCTKETNFNREEKRGNSDKRKRGNREKEKERFFLSTQKQKREKERTNMNQSTIWGKNIESTNQIFTRKFCF